MAEIATELVSVERALWSGAATSVTAQTTEGEIGILPGHEPILGQLVENGVVIIRTTDGEKKVAAVQGGFLSVGKHKVSILADHATWSSEVDVSSAEQSYKGSDTDSHVRAQAQSELRAVQRAKEK